MNAILSTTLLAVTVVVCATVAVCTGSIGVGDYIALVGASAGGAGAVHVGVVGKTGSANGAAGGG